MNPPKITTNQIEEIFQEAAGADEDTHLRFAFALIVARDAQWQAALAEQGPVGYMSAEQLPLIKDRDGEEGGHYIPMRKSPAGLFTLALYTHLAPTIPAAQERAEPVAPAVGECVRLRKDASGVVWVHFDAPDGGKAMLSLTNIVNDKEERAPGFTAKIMSDALTALSATPPAPAQPTPWQTFRQVTVALSGLLEQVEKFVSKNGEADFETGEALRAVEAAIAFDDQMPAQPSPEPSKPEQAEAPSYAPLTGRTHDLKTDSPVFSEVVAGRKLFEIRKDDRGFQCGDLLRLRETRLTGAEMAAGEPLTYTGREQTVRVIGILHGPKYGLADGWVIMSIATLPPASAAGERPDLSQWEKARFGYFDQAGRFVEFSGEDNELPNDSSPRWVGGRHDMQLLRAALATKPQAEQAATPPAQTVQDYEAHQANGLAWAVSKWNDEVSRRPLINVHRRTLDDTWRQVIRYFGGDPVALLGLAHDDLLIAARTRGDEVGKS